ncbi:hypothetical protein MTO96_026268 [Rhipicephalus appendiculatus]
MVWICAKPGCYGISTAIFTAAGITAIQASTDLVCPNVVQNIVVVCTEKEDNAGKILALKSIRVNGKEHEVAVYAAAEGNYVKGVIRNVERDIVKRIKETGSVVVLFDGGDVPSYIRVGQAIVRCYLYKKQIEVCSKCTRVGHRADVCPTPLVNVCHNCGAKDPKQGHSCQVRCKLCGKAHSTGDKACKQKYQTPFVVRQRRKEREMELAFDVDLRDFPTLQAGQPGPSSGGWLQPFTMGGGSALPVTAKWASKEKNTEPYRAQAGPSTQHAQRPRGGLVFCTVGDTLLVPRPITEGVCDYAVFADVQPTDDGFEPVNGRHAWEVFKRGVSEATKTVGGVSFSPVSGETTLRRLAAMGAELSALAHLQMAAMGMLNIRDQHWAKESLGAAFREFRVALNNLKKAVTFLGVWLRTAQDAENFVDAIKSANYVDLVILQTHVVPYVGMSDPCIVYTISQRNADGVVPSYDVADKVVEGVRGSRRRLLFSSTLAAVAYVGAKNGADISSYRNKLDGWAFFDVQRDVYWPCGLGDSYQRLKLAASLLRPSEASQ